MRRLPLLPLVPLLVVLVVGCTSTPPEVPPPPPEEQVEPTGVILIDFAEETAWHLPGGGAEVADEPAAIDGAGFMPMVVRQELAFPAPGVVRFHLVNVSGRTMVDAASVERVRFLVTAIEAQSAAGAPVGGASLMNADGYLPNTVAPFVHLDYDGSDATPEIGLPAGGTAGVRLEFALPVGASRVRIEYRLLATVAGVPAALATNPGWVTPVVGLNGQPGTVNGPAYLARVGSTHLANCAGTLYFADNMNRVRRSRHGEVFDHTTAGLSDVAGIACWSSGASLERIVVSDWGTHQVKFLLPDGGVAEVVGSGAFGAGDGAASAAQFRYPRGMAVVGQSVFVLDEVGAVRRLDRVAGVWQVTTLASGLSGPLYDLTSDGIDTLYFTAGGPAAGVYRLSLSGGPAIRVLDDPTIMFTYSSIVRLGSVGFVLAARLDDRLHLLTPGETPDTLVSSPLAGTGAVGSVAGGASAAEATITAPYGLATDGAGSLFVSLYGQGQIVRIDPPVGYEIPLPVAR